MNDAMNLSERADALEHKMMRELDAIIVKSRLFNSPTPISQSPAARRCSAPIPANT